MGSYQRYADMYDSPSLFGISAFPQRLLHCVKSVQILSFFWSIFSCIRTGYGPEKTPYLDTSRSVDHEEQVCLSMCDLFITTRHKKG